MHFKRPMEAPGIAAADPATPGAFFGSRPEPLVEKTEEPKLEMTATAREPAAEPGAPVA